MILKPQHKKERSIDPKTLIEMITALIHLTAELVKLLRD